MKKKIFGVLFAAMLVFSMTGLAVADSNQVQSAVHGSSFHDVGDNYGNQKVGGWGYTTGEGKYKGRVKDSGGNVAENYICGRSDTNGYVTYNDHDLYVPGQPTCECLDNRLGPFNNRSYSEAKTYSSAGLSGEGTLKNGRLQAKGSAGEGSWSLTKANKNNWADGWQAVEASYKVTDCNPGLNDSLNGWAKVEGGAATQAYVDNQGNIRNAKVGSRVGNDAQVRAYGGKKHFTMNGSGDVNGATLIGGKNFVGYAGGTYHADYNYRLNSTRGVAGWNGDGGAKGVTGASIMRGTNRLDASSYSCAGAHACPKNPQQ